MGMFDDLLADSPETPQQVPTTPSAGMFDDLLAAPDEDGGVVETVVEAGKEIGRTVASGGISLIQGVTELGAAGVDLALGTSTSRPTTEFFEYVKGGVKPETKAGEIGEELTAFALGFIPVIGWLGRASKAARAAKVGMTVPAATGTIMRSAERFGTSSLGRAALSSKTGLIGSTALATAAVETVVTPDGRVNMADSFDIFAPLQSEADTGLMGREEALRRLRNKARHGVIGAGTSLAFDGLLVGLGATAKGIGATKTGAAAAQGIRTGFDLLGRGAMAIPGVAPTVAAGRRVFSPMGGADARIAEEAFDTLARQDQMEGLGLRAYAEYEAELKKALGMSRLFGAGKRKAQRAEYAISQYLRGLGPRPTELGEGVAKAADKLLEVSTGIRGRFLDAVEREAKAAPVGSARKKALDEAIEKLRMFQDSEQGFLRRVFLVHKDPLAYYRSLKIEARPTAELVNVLSRPGRQSLSPYEEAVVEVAYNQFKQDFRRPEALEAARAVVNETIGLKAINTGSSPEAAIKAIVESSRREATEAPKVGVLSYAAPRFKLTPTLLTPRKAIVEDSPKLRKLMGEIENPKQLFLQTVGDMAKTTAALNFYRNITDDASRMVTPLADAIPAIAAGQRPLFVRTPDMANDLTGFDMTPFFQRAQEANIRRTLPTQGVPAGLGGKETPESIIESFEQQLQQAGYVKLGDATKASQLDDPSVFPGQYGSLTGIYVAPEALQAVTVPATAMPSILEDVVGSIIQLQGFASKMTIVFNPETQVRNVLGNLSMLFGTGNLGRQTDLYDVYRIFTSNLADMTDDGLKRLSETVGLSGATESSLVIKALQEFRESGRSLSLSGKTRNGLDLIEKAIPFNKFMQDFYSNSDSFFKAVAVISEQNKLLRAFADAGELIPGRDPLLRGIPDSRLVRELVDSGVSIRSKSAANPELSSVELMAADAVKAMFPIYNRTGSFIRALDKFPLFGNFTSFASENIRNSINILDRGLKEMSFRVSDRVRAEIGEEAARAFEKNIRSIGAHRLLSFTTMAAVVPQTVVRSAMSLSGTSPEQMEAIQRRLPPYTQGHDLMILSNDQKGKVEYYNLSAMFPYSFVMDPAKAALRAYAQQGDLGKSEAQQILSGVWAGLSGYADPFASQSMVMEKIADVLPRSAYGRGGATTTGSLVYRDADSMSEKILSSLAHLTSVFTPGMFREIVEVRSGDIRPGRLLRAATGMSGPQGEQYDLSAEFAMFMTGLRPMELNLRRDFQFVGNEYTPRRQGLKSDASRYITAPDRTPEEMISAWQYYLDGLYREQGKLYGAIQDARTMGMSDRDIRRNLIGEANIGREEVNSIMNGKFHPGTVTTETLKEIRIQERLDRINRVTPRSEIPNRLLNQMSRERAGQELIPLRPETEAPAVDAPRNGMFDDLLEAPQAPSSPPVEGLFDDLLQERQGAVMPPPAFDSAPAPSAPQLPSAPANRASLSPALLGDNPFSQSANMEIAQRLSG